VLWELRDLPERVAHTLAAVGCGGNPAILVSGQDRPLFITVDSTSVYWTNNGDGTVMKLTPK
jgi:hypothetical protein